MFTNHIYLIYMYKPDLTLITYNGWYAIKPNQTEPNGETKSGFKFSKTDTKGFHFCYKHKLHNDTKLQLENKDIPVVNEYKFLRMIFDKKTFIPHINYLKPKCNKAFEFLLRLALQSLRTSPVEILYVEVNESPPNLRYNKLVLQYYTKLKASSINSIYRSTFKLKYRNLFQQKEKAIKIFGLQIEPICGEAKYQ